MSLSPSVTSDPPDSRRRRGDDNVDNPFILSPRRECATKVLMALPKPAPGTTKWWIIGILGCAVMAALVIWYGARANVGAVTPAVTAYQVTSDSSITVEYRVVRPADRAVTCAVTALDKGKSPVGTVTDHIPAGESVVQRSVDIRTTQRAVTGVVSSCVRD